MARVVLHLDVVVDDGDSLAPGPQVEPVTLPLSGVPAFLAGLPAELERLAASLPPEPPDA